MWACFAEKPFCAYTAQRIVWCLQNRILVSVKSKLQAITSGNGNNRPYMVIYSIAPWEIITFQHQKLYPRRYRYKSAVS